jgi:hypothetical protein
MRDESRASYFIFIIHPSSSYFLPRLDARCDRGETTEACMATRECLQGENALSFKQIEQHRNGLQIIAMRHRLIQWVGIAWTLLYAAFVVWLYATAPQSIKDVTTQASVAAGTYAVDRVRFDAGRELFLREQYAAARGEWERADPARRDARTQFYIAYSFYRQGWGRVYNDDALFRQGLEAADRADSLSPDAPLAVDDAELKIHSAAELKAELEKGLERTVDDLNPLKVFRERK